jgi:hypothetical protein
LIVAIITAGLFWMIGAEDSASEADHEILTRAETAFQRGVEARGTSDESRHFQEAAKYYEELHRRGFHNPALDMNLGNANLLGGEWPQAILAYRRGLRSNLNNFQMRGNLAFARDQVVYSSADNFARPPVSFWPPWMPRITVDVAFWSTLGFYVLAWVGLARRWTITKDTCPWITWVGMAGAVCFAMAFLLQVRSEKWESEHPVVVISANQTYLQKGNHDLYPRAYETPLNRGVEAHLIQIRGDWLQIELAGGQMGWIAREKALVDLD